MRHPPAWPDHIYCMSEWSGTGVASEGAITWRCLPVCKYETICRQRAVWSLSLFLSFTELIFLQYTQALFHCTQGQNVNTASAHSVLVCVCIYSCWPLCAWAACLDWLPVRTVWIYKFVFMSPAIRIAPCSVCVYVCLCLYICCLFHC